MFINEFIKLNIKSEKKFFIIELFFKMTFYIYKIDKIVKLLYKLLLRYL